jgi:hypothetical protein
MELHGHARAKVAPACAVSPGTEPEAPQGPARPPFALSHTGSPGGSTDMNQWSYSCAGAKRTSGALLLHLQNNGLDALLLLEQILEHPGVGE